MISSKNVNQKMLKISYSFENNYKKPQALEITPPNPNWPPAAGGSALRPSPSCDLTHTYYTAIKSFKFVALLTEGFLRENFREDLFCRTHYTFGNILF